MTRTLFFFTTLAAMLVAMTAILIRVELAYPGISPLFQTGDGAADGTKFGHVTAAHSGMAYLCVMLMGTTMCAAAQAQGAAVAAVFKWLGVLICGVSFALFVAAQIPATVAPALMGEGVGWVLYPPLSTTGPTTLFEQLIDTLDVGEWIYLDLTRVLLLPACALLYIGAYQMLSTIKGYSWVSVAGALLVLVVCGLMGLASPIITLPYQSVSLLIVTLPFIALASAHLIDEAPPWLIVLTLGALLTSLVQMLVPSYPGLYASAGTMAEAALFYVFPLGLVWFALPALVLFTRPTTLHPALIWALPAVIFGALAVWVLPLLKVGTAGMPYNYVDYPDSFAPDNLSATTGVILFTLIYLGLVTFVRRCARG